MLEQVALAGLAMHPELLDDFADALEEGQWQSDDHVRFAAALLSVDPTATPEDVRSELEARLGEGTVDSILAGRHVRISPVARGDAAVARPCIHDALSKLAARRGAERERREAVEDFEAGGGDEALTWRLGQAARRRDEAMRPQHELAAADDDDAAGASEYLQGLLDTEVWKKKRRK
jgi:DNA primase